jgi:choline-sulfatase
MPARHAGIFVSLVVLCGACSRPRAAPAEAIVTATPQSSPVAAAADAAPPAPKGPPKDLNVILLSIDCLRADMPWAGYPHPIAPRLTELEKRAVSYTRAYSLSSYTSMSLGGMLGGKLPSEMRRDGYFFSTYPRDNVMFPELIQAAGIHTMTAHAHGYFRSAGFDQGFDAYEMVPDLKWNPTTDENITSPQLETIAERLLSDPRNDTSRFYAWFHFLDPHDQYLPHPDITPYGKTARARYDAEVTFTDGYIGKLLDFVASRPWAARTAIVVTADHGEAFGEHGELLHGFEVWQELVRIPLLFVVPGAAPRHIDEARSAVDFAPTILDLLGVPRDSFRDAGDPGFEGVSLVPELYGASAEARDVVVDLPATSDNGPRRAMVHGHWKLISFDSDHYFQLYDLDADPGEHKPITRGDDYTEMRARYRAYTKTLHEKPAYACGEDCLNGGYRKAAAADAGIPE